MIQGNAVSFSYHKKGVLHDCSFSIPQGSVCGILGQNGVGKTTLLKLLSGLLIPDSGSVQVHGYEPKRRRREFYEQIAYVPQNPSTPTILVSTYAEMCGPLYPDFSLDVWKSLVERFRVNKLDSFAELSGGDLRKAWLCFALACRTPVLLLDEPTQGLDISSQETFREVIAEESAEQRTIVLSTHHIREIEHVLDSVVFVSETGSIIHTGRCEDLCNSYHMEEAGSPTHLPTDRLYARRTATGWICLKKGPAQHSQTIPLEFLFHALTSPQNTMEHAHETPRSE